MSDRSRIPASVIRIPSVVRCLGGIDESGAHHVQVWSAYGSYDALTWLPGISFWSANGVEATGQAVVAELADTGFDSEFALLGFRKDESIRLRDLVPRTACPISGVRDQMLALIDEIEGQEIRAFVERAMQTVGAFNCFWTCPASIRDHHAYPGGLAKHSLEVATLVANGSMTSREDRDLGIAFSILHDLGKVWAYEHGQLTEVAAILGHEQLAYARLAPLLTELEQHDASAGTKMRGLLAGEWRNGARRRALAIGAVVAAFDSLSCEQFRNRSGAR